jgi:hypothetical protein
LFETLIYFHLDWRTPVFFNLGLLRVTCFKSRSKKQSGALYVMGEIRILGTRKFLIGLFPGRQNTPKRIVYSVYSICHIYIDGYKSNWRSNTRTFMRNYTSSLCDTINRKRAFIFPWRNKTGRRSIEKLLVGIMEVVLCFGSPNSDNKIGAMTSS